MTPANKRAAALVTALLLVQGALHAQEQTSEITSNFIYGLAGRGDTLWMLTSRGVNYTVTARRDPIAWSGFLDIELWAGAFGNGRFLGCVYDEEMGSTYLWLFNHADESGEHITLSYAVDAADTSRFFFANHAAWSPGRFWVACHDGGLMRIDTAGMGARLFIPGIDKSTFRPTSFPPDSLEDSLGGTRRALYAAVDDSGYVWVACEKGLWRLNPADTTWYRAVDTLWEIDSIPARDTVQAGDSTIIRDVMRYVPRDTLLSVERFLSCAVRFGGADAAVYAIAAMEIQRDNETFVDTTVLRYWLPRSRWTRFISRSTDVPTDIELGAQGRVYLIQKNQINLYLDTLADTLPPHEIPAIRGGRFQDRFPISDTLYPELYDMLYLAGPRDTMLWIATSNGLFFSRDEHAHEGDDTPFKWIFREKVIEAGLEEVYAYPSILNYYQADRAIFAYNLSQNARVTIDIYDFNMDHVIRIIDGEHRIAGKNRTDGSGRSTEVTTDYWDGTYTNRGGKPVAPGLYYFRIKTDKGERAFGKIVVALSEN